MSVLIQHDLDFAIQAHVSVYQSRDFLYFFHYCEYFENKNNSFVKLLTPLNILSLCIFSSN